MITSPTAPGSFYAQKLDKQDPKKVAGQFESIFYRMLFQQMRDMQEENPLFGSSQSQQVLGMFHDELADKLGETRQLGIGDLVMQEIEEREEIEERKHA